MKQEPITDVIAIHPHLLQKFMNQGKSFQNVLCLYTFYLYHAQLQKTNQILATNSFVHNGLGWGLDKIKKTKKILKDLEVIEVKQKGYYSYIHLLYLYTKKKIVTILNSAVKSEPKKVEVVKPTKAKEKTVFQKILEEKKVSSKKIDEIRNILNSLQKKKVHIFNPLALAKWIGYCENSNIKYSTNNLKYWLKKMDKTTSLEQLKSIDKAISKNWKDFYIPDLKHSYYQKFLGRSLMMDRHCDTLTDVMRRDDKFIYIFRNLSITTKEPLDKLFDRYEDHGGKNTPITSKVLKLLGGVVKRI